MKELASLEYEKGCAHKHAYRDKGRARVIQAKVNRRIDDGSRVEVYKCGFGRHYHVGHPPKAKFDRATLRELKTALT